MGKTMNEAATSGEPVFGMTESADRAILAATRSSGHQPLETGLCNFDDRETLKRPHATS